MDIALDTINRCLPPDGDYIPAFISPMEEIEAVNRLDAGPWNIDLKRRVQHFGYRYDYKARAVTSDAYLGALPDWLQYMGQKLVAAGHFKTLPDQVIANEYLPGQGISAHVDCEPCFSDTIVSISLLSSCTMVFQKKEGNAKLVITLEPHSIIILKGEARYKWTHEIPARKSDHIDGMKTERSRRISLTFRKVIGAL